MGRKLNTRSDPSVLEACCADPVAGPDQGQWRGGSRRL